MEIFGLQASKSKPMAMFPSKKCYFLVEDPKNPSWLSPKNCNEGVK